MSTATEAAPDPEGPDPEGPDPEHPDPEHADPGSSPADDRPAGRDRFGLGLAAITLGGLAWRVIFTLVTKGSDTNLFDEGDAFFYSNVARNLAAGRWYVNPFNGSPAADHPPLTVLVLGPASWLFHFGRLSGHVILAQRLTMTVVGTLVVAAVGLLGRTVAGRSVGLAAAAIAAVNPNLWINDALIMSESISALLIVALLATGYRLAARPTLGRAAVAGAVCGLTVLARAEVGLFLPLMIAPLLLRAPGLSWAQRVGRLATATAMVALVIAPWALWNQTRFREPVPLSTNDGTTLLGANCPETYNSNIVGGWSLNCVLQTKVTGLDASQASSKQRRLGIDYAKHHVGRLPVVLVAREGRTFGFWRPDQSVYVNTGEGRPEWASWMGFACFWALVPVSVLGVIGMRRRGITLVPMLACLLTSLAVSAFFYGIPRFRLPVDLATCLLAAVAVADLRSRAATRFATARA